MRKSVILPVLGTMLVALTSTIAASGVDGSYNCSSTSACFSASQTAPAGSSGTAFHGSAVNAAGVRGNSTNAAGTLGQSASGSMMYPGIEGESTNNSGTDVAGGFGLTGISGTAPAYGVYALGSLDGIYGETTASGNNTGYGVIGFDSNTNQGNDNSGLVGVTTNGNAVSAYAGPQTLEFLPGGDGIALQALNGNRNGTGAIIGTPSGTLYLGDGAVGLLDDSQGKFAVDYNGNETLGGSLSISTTDSSGNNQYVQTNYTGYILDGGYKASGATASGFNFQNNGDETLTGTLHAAAVGTTDSNNNQSYIQTSASGDIVYGGYKPAYSTAPTGSFYVTDAGNEVLSGTLTTSRSTYARTRGVTGAERIAYGTRSTAPAIDDVGGGQLVQGSAYVRLDPDLADVIDRRLEYRVFITPEGDCKGLYITAKSPAGFMVRELQGGRSNIAFDYRIVAKPFDEDGRRLATAPIERPFTTPTNASNRVALPFVKPAAIAVHHHAMLRKMPASLRILDPFAQLKARLGPAKFAAAIAEFKRQHR